MGRASVLISTAKILRIVHGKTSVLICVLMYCPAWAKITRTVHGKTSGQRADMCTDGLSSWAKITPDIHSDKNHDMCTDGLSAWVSCPRQSAGRTSVLICVLTDSPVGEKITQTVPSGRGQRADMCTDVLSPWAKITRTVRGKGQHSPREEQRADMCTSGRSSWAKITQTVPLTFHQYTVVSGRTVLGGENHPNSPREGQRADMY
uniref:Uncharacterized protein n=1 Tax=Brassica oleracea TaxID=3712 RepID=A0A3P6G552_BRAOL|nr:unnamed protein product [Brassica oleracea]